MAIIKAPPKQPKSVTIQARVEESVKTQLDQYAKFIDSTPSYVITEALKLLYRKDKDFQSWLGQHTKDRKSTRLNSSHGYISYAVFCLKKKKKQQYEVLLTGQHTQNSGAVARTEDRLDRLHRQM